MRNDIKEETWLNAAQCAKRVGLTVRALRVYEQTGLIHPRRSGKNWRLYGASEIARLSEILTLKRLGFTLQHIARLLGGQPVDLDRMLDMQNLGLQEQLARTQQSLAIVDALRAKTAAGDLLSVDEAACFIGSLPKIDGEPGFPERSPRPPSSRVRITF